MAARRRPPAHPSDPEGVLDVGDDQLLVLLFVMQAQLGELELLGRSIR